MKTDSATHRKDSSPSATIARARGALERIGVWLYESSWCEPGPSAYSARVSDAAWPVDAAVGANGKGTTRELTLASAYAEYLERLQNLFLEPFNTNYGTMPALLELPDAVRLTVRELFEAHPATMANLLPPDALERFPGIELVCLPFYDATSDRIEVLPRKLLNWSCLSSGMAAGNTPEEALVAGICEVLERYASRRVYHERLVLPEIPTAALDGTHASDQIRSLAEQGLRVLVRDASLGLAFPVVAVAIVDPDTAQFQVKFGAAPTLALAVVRCTTELLQGRHSIAEVPMFPAGWDSDPSMDPAEFQRAFHAWRRDGSGPFPSSILSSRGRPRHDEHFERVFEGNRATLGSLRRLIEASGHRLLVRDTSFLGFPTFRVYVPGLSEVHGAASAERLELLTTAWERTTRTLLHLGSAGNDDLRVLLHDLERYRKDPRFSSVAILENISGVVLSPRSPFRRLFSLDYLLTLLSLRLGDHGRAARHLGSFLREARRGGEPSMDFDYLRCASQWLDGQVAGIPEDELRALVTTCYGEALLAEVEADLRNPSAVFDPGSLPACGDCSACPVQRDCRYEVWRNTAERIRVELDANPIDQLQLRDVLKV